MKKIIILIILSLALVGCQAGLGDSNENSNQSQASLDLTNKEQLMPSEKTTQATQAIIKTNFGEITVQFYNNDAPKAVANFVNLAQAGFYDGTKFHRVIKGFMIQGGDPLTKDDSLKSHWGTGGPEYRFEDEINNYKLVRGSLAMANSGPNTNGSQFFIVTADETPWLDGRHTNFGKVISGIDIVSLIENVQTEGPDRPVQNVIIESIELQ